MDPVNMLLRMIRLQREKPSFTRKTSCSIPSVNATSAMEIASTPERLAQKDSGFRPLFCMSLILASLGMAPTRDFAMPAAYATAVIQIETLENLYFLRLGLEYHLFHRYGLGQVARLVNVTSTADRNVVCQQLQRDNLQNRRKQLRRPGNINHVIH